MTTIYKEVTIPEETVLEPEKKKCDRCEKEYFIAHHEDAPGDLWEAQEFLHINHGCGFGSIFGDLNTIECDLCQHCVKDLLGPLLRITGIWR